MEKVEKILIGLFFLLLLVAIFGWQSEMELRGEEPRRAVITFEMIFNDNYWRPTLNGWDYYNKPPLFNWVQSLLSEHSMALMNGLSDYLPIFYIYIFLLEP